MNEQINVTESVTSPVGSGNLSFAGLIQVFTSPGQFFEKLKNSPKILMPYLVIVVVSMLGIYLASSLMTRERFEEMMLKPKMAEVLKQQRVASGLTEEQFIKSQETPGAVSILVARVLAPLIIGALLLFVGNFLMGGAASFKQVLSLVLYTEVLFAIGFLFVSILIVMKGSAAVSFSPAILIIEDGMTSTLFVALSQLSLFHIWQVVVLGIGSSQIFGISSNKGYVVSVLSVGTIVLLNIAMAGVMNAFLG